MEKDYNWNKLPGYVDLVNGAVLSCGVFIINFVIFLLLSLNY